MHLQGVPLAKRFAIVPMGPPLLTYSSVCSVCLPEYLGSSHAHTVKRQTYRCCTVAAASCRASCGICLMLYSLEPGDCQLYVTQLCLHAARQIPAN